MAWHPFRNFGLKVVAVGLGLLLWFTVSGQQAERMISGVPIVYRNKPTDLEITDQTNLVDIHVRGLDSQLRAALPRDFEAGVDLTGARPGTQEFMLRTDHVMAPFGLEVTKVEPGSVVAVLEMSGAANLPVEPLIEGTPAPGYVVSATVAEPSSVNVIGPARLVAGATGATTDRVSIEGAKTTVTANVRIGVLDAALRLREPRSARVTVTIEAAGERPFPAMRVAVRNLGPGRRGVVEPAVVSVLLRGPQTRLARLDPATIAPYVDVTGLAEGRYEVPVLFDLTGPLSVASVRPATVTVVIN
jgi:YbbR domain-containing protein